MSFRFHLCQSPVGSCGACCGLYNFRDHSREALTRTLSRRTARMRETPKEPEAYRAAARALRRWDKDPLFDAVKICPLLGFLDEEEKRVGCLAHPAVTGGEDLRDCGAYTSKTCASFECPSFLWLNGGMAELVAAACPDWYLYGLVITDVELVKGVLRLLEREAGEAIDPHRIVANADALSHVATVFSWKGQGPIGEGIFGRFERDELGEPTSRILDYEGLGAKAAPEDDLLLCLGAIPRSADELEEGRSLIRRKLRGAAAALGCS